MLDRLLSVLSLCAADRLERVAELEHDVAHVVDLAQQLLVEQPGPRAATVQAEPAADIAEASIRLADRVFATFDIGEVREDILLQDLRLILPEPLLTSVVLVVRVLDAFVLKDHAEDRTQAADLPIAEDELERRSFLRLLGLRRDLLQRLALQTVAAHPLVVHLVVALEVDLHRGLGTLRGVGDRDDLGGEELALRLGLHTHALLEA
mmetsp:Transcript_85705/g.245981  ORF Transcript_85705/g.245981 Transcript_85705/m.245981 type:complete len:207 (+) Transcript_85705:359-979(+)